MGIWAAKSAVLVAARLGLSDKAARCLTHMALEVLDKRDDERAIDARRYFRGRDSLAIAIGYIDDAVITPAARSAVKRAIAQLIECGAIQVFRVGHAGYRTEYYLRVRSDGVASDELLPALVSTPALSQGSARRTPVRKTSNGLRTRTQRDVDPQVRQKQHEVTSDKGPPGVPHEVRPADLQGYAGRDEGVRPAVDKGPPGVPPNRTEQQERDEQHLTRTRALARAKGVA